MSEKFKKKLVGQITAEEKEIQEQKELRKKYDVHDEVLIVEKNNTVKYLFKSFGLAIRLAATIIIFFLSVVGLCSIVYPDTRYILIEQMENIYSELQQLIPFLK